MLARKCLGIVEFSSCLYYRSYVNLKFEINIQIMAEVGGIQVHGHRGLLLTKSKLGRIGFIWLSFSHPCSLLKEVRAETPTMQQLEAGVNTEATKDCCSLDFSSRLAQPTFL